MDKPCRGQECLIKSKEKLRLRDRDRVGREICDCHESAKDHHREREPAQNGTVTPRQPADPVRSGDQETEDINKLPAERIEEPGSLDRPGRQICA